jgi:hypothetical protein
MKHTLLAAAALALLTTTTTACALPSAVTPPSSAHAEAWVADDATGAEGLMALHVYDYKCKGLPSWFLYKLYADIRALPASTVKTASYNVATAYTRMGNPAFCAKMKSIVLESAKP